MVKILIKMKKMLFSCDNLLNVPVVTVLASVLITVGVGELVMNMTSSIIEVDARQMEHIVLTNMEN